MNSEEKETVEFEKNLINGTKYARTSLKLKYVHKKHLCSTEVENYLINS